MQRPYQTDRLALKYLNPLKTIIIALLCTCFIGQGLRWIIIDDDLMKIIPDNIPSMIAWDKVIDEFGSTDFMFIAFGRKGKKKRSKF